MHTVPAGFPRIRHYGFLANCHRADKLEYCRRLLMPGACGLLPQPEVCAEMKEALTEKEGISIVVRTAVLAQ